MKRVIKIVLLVFVFVSGSIAGIGLLLMDSTLKNLLNPVLLVEAPDVGSVENSMAMKIRVADDSFANGLYVTVPDAEFVVLYCHDGNGNLYENIEMVNAFTELGVSVLALDYRGFGMSSSVEVSDESMHKDLLKAYSALRREKWNSSRIIVYGQGISAGIQGDMLQKKQCAAWIMDNPIPSLQDSTESPIRQLLTVDRLSVFDSLSNLRAPVMVIYDETVVREDKIQKIQSSAVNFTRCTVRGNRSRDMYDSVDWDAWKTCMTDLLSTFERASVDPTGQEIPAKMPMKKGITNE